MWYQNAVANQGKVVWFDSFYTYAGGSIGTDLTITLHEGDTGGWVASPDVVGWKGLFFVVLIGGGGGKIIFFKLTD